MRRRDEGEDVPIPEFLSIDRPVGRRSSPPRVCTQDANFSVCKLCIGRYANARNMCAPSFSNPFPPSTAEDDRERAWYLHILDISSHCIGTIVPWVPGWDADSYVHDGSKPLIRISHWIEPVLGLTDCLECSQDRCFRLFNVFPAQTCARRCFIYMSIRYFWFSHVKKQINYTFWNISIRSVYNLMPLVGE